MSDNFNAGIEAAALKPCPFCKSRCATAMINVHGWKVVKCDDCGAGGPCIDLEGDQYIDRWNTRPSSSAPVEQREAGARIIDPGAFYDDPIDRHKYCSPLRAEVVQESALAKADAILSVPGSSRDEVLEEAAKVAECAGCGDPKCSSCYGNQIASAIRALNSGGAK